MSSDSIRTWDQSEIKALIEWFQLGDQTIVEIGKLLLVGSEMLSNTHIW